MEDTVPAENRLAQRLAANDKTTRDRALKRLNKYLTVRSKHELGLSDADLLKIWKGLFYCMWMQDKPLIQEELSQRITSLLHCFSKTEDGLRFVKVFLETMSREWNGIDKLRLDKFMMMTRDMLHETFLLMSKGDWQECDSRQLALSIHRNVVCAHKADMPDGLKHHLADIFQDELEKVSTEKGSSPGLTLRVKKKVVFDLGRNRANKFQDYLESLVKQPESPFEATKSPMAGILKSPGISSAPTTSSSATSPLSSKKDGDKRSRQSHESPLSSCKKRRQTDNGNPPRAKRRKTKTVDVTS